MAIEPESLDKILDAIKKKFGDDSVRKGDEFKDMMRVPTGIIQLDSLIGGGFPMGRIVHPYGGFGSGKTLTCLHMIKEAQNMGLTCAYYDLEKQYSPTWAKSIGVDTNSLLVLEGSEIEKTGEKIDALLGAINVHVVDSLGAGSSIDELAAGIDEWRPGIQSRAWGKVIRRILHRMDKEENLVVLINQTREVFGKAGGEKPTGGVQIEFASSLSLHFTKSSWLYRDKYGNLSPDGKKVDAETGRTAPDGIDLVVAIKKSRVCEPFGTARMRLEFGTGGHFDEIWALTRSAIMSGVIQKSGSWYTLPNGERVQGESKVKDYIKENNEFAEQLRNSYFMEEE